MEKASITVLSHEHFSFIHFVLQPRDVPCSPVESRLFSVFPFSKQYHNKHLHMCIVVHVSDYVFREFLEVMDGIYSRESKEKEASASDK